MPAFAGMTAASCVARWRRQTYEAVPPTVIKSIFNVG